MKKYGHLAFCLFAAFLSFNCASTEITSYVDPDYKQTKFTKILVTADTDKLDFRFKIEKTLSSALIESGTAASASYEFFPPTRVITDSAYTAVLAANHFDGSLIISVGEKGVETTQNPIVASKTTGTVSANGVVDTKTTYLGGDIVNKPFAEFGLKLLDVKTGNVAWMANSFTGGNAYANFGTLYNNFCKKVVETLDADKMIVHIDPETKWIDGKSGRH